MRRRPQTSALPPASPPILQAEPSLAPADYPAPQRFLRIDAGAAVPGAVRREVEATSLLADHRLQDAAQPGLVGRVGALPQRLDGAVEVAVHEVGRADPVLAATTGAAEPEDPGVLEKAAEDRAYADVVGHTGDARSQRADAADDQ